MPPESLSKPIGAFCVDISNSVDRIDRIGQRAFEQHRIFLKTLVKTILEESPLNHRPDVTHGDIWVPGDAVWGVFYAAPDCSLKESIKSALSFGIYTCANALSEALQYATQQPEKHREDLLDFALRGVFLVGEVIYDQLLDKSDSSPTDHFRLYSGNALNACGRLEKEAEDNQVLIGYVDSPESLPVDTLFELQAGSPVLKRIDLERFLSKKHNEQDPGCFAYLDSLIEQPNSENEPGQEYLRFSSRKLRGLNQSSVQYSAAHLKPSFKESGIFVRSLAESKGIIKLWNRVVVEQDWQESYDLLDLLKDIEHPAFGHFNEIYRKGDLILKTQQPDAQQSGLWLECHAERFKLRSSTDDDTQQAIDFSTNRYAFLHTKPARLGLWTLVQGESAQDNQDASIFRMSLVKDEPNIISEFYSTRMDSSWPSIEFHIKQNRPSS